MFPLHFRQEILAFTRGNTCVWLSLESQLFPDESVKETYMFLQKNVMSTECKFLQPLQQEFYNYNNYNDDDDNNNHNNHRFVFLKTLIFSLTKNITDTEISVVPYPKKTRKKKSHNVTLVEFMYLVFTRMPGESYRRRLRSLLYLCYVFLTLINYLVC